MYKIGLQTSLLLSSTSMIYILILLVVGLPSKHEEELSTMKVQLPRFKLPFIMIKLLC